MKGAGGGGRKGKKIKLKNKDKKINRDIESKKENGKLKEFRKK